MVDPIRSMTLAAMLERRLADLDKAWATVRAIHADALHLNEVSKENREAREKLAACERALWRLKGSIGDDL